MEDDQAPEQRCLAHAQIRAQFEATKNDDAVRRRFDPREHQKAVDARNGLAVSTAESFLKVRQRPRLRLPSDACITRVLLHKGAQ